MSEQGDEGCQQLEGIKELEGGVSCLLRMDICGADSSSTRWDSRKGDCIFAITLNTAMAHRFITSLPYVTYNIHLDLANYQFGTPHFGISALLPCPTPPTLSCILAARAARVGIYTTYAQTHLVQAQYYRDAERLDQFMEMNEFLRDLNAEKKGTGEKLTWEEKGGKGVSGLDNLVAIMFDADRIFFSILYMREGLMNRHRIPRSIGPFRYLHPRQ
jgi:hypothetical protein